MNTNRAREAWQRIEHWLGTHLPEALDALDDPASEAQLTALEHTIGFTLPESFKTVYRVHDGDREGNPCGLLGGWDEFLSLARINEYWRQTPDPEPPDDEDSLFGHWRRQIEDGIISVKGPVKPLTGSRCWLPVTSMNGDVLRFLDFDPAPGGQSGQVIEVDFESGCYQVVAPSLTDFLVDYADGLERGDYAVADGTLEPVDETDPATWGVPGYLRSAHPDAVPDDTPDIPAIANLTAGEKIVLVGRMGQLLGGPETLFELITPQGREYRILATRKVTRGYSAIAVRQWARVTAERYSGQVDSVFVAHGMAAPPQLLARRYERLEQP
ncbi:MAG: SMI1/KNR4 family protein [Candidatus Competibacterales bacterium]|nr:SMI1/KNR4 family protein [Candidatus Competibacterales bacterium]